MPNPRASPQAFSEKAPVAQFRQNRFANPEPQTLPITAESAFGLVGPTPATPRLLRSHRATH
ncbi:hypothetical protein D3C80_1950920 [compost metagenome]